MKVKGRTTKQRREQHIVVDASGSSLGVKRKAGGKGTQDSLLTTERVYEGRGGFWFNANFFNTRSFITFSLLLIHTNIPSHSM